MFDLKNIPLPSYSALEDRHNSLTHAVGVPLGIIGLWKLLQMQLGAATKVQITATVLYLVSMTGVFLGSAIYHGMRPCFGKRIARLIDHCNIYVMITCTNGSLFLAHMYPTNPKLAVWLIVSLCVLSAIGILLTFMDLKKFNVPQIFTYVLLGWVAAFGMRYMYAEGDAGRHFVNRLLLGGVFITTGAMIYLIGRRVRYLHAVFHVFVLLGSIVIYFGTYGYYKMIL